MKSEKPKSGRIAVAVLTGMFVVVAVWWTLYFPYDRRRLYSAVPPGSVLVTEHEFLGSRWDSICGNRLAAALIESAGAGNGEIERARTDPGARQAVKRLFSRNTVTAFCPRLGSARQPAWVFATWTGIYGKFIRWTWIRNMLTDIETERVARDFSHPVWVAKDSAGTEMNPLKFSFSVVEGMLVACLSPDANAAGYIADRIDMHAALLPELAARLEPDTQSDWLATAPDRAWIIYQDVVPAADSSGPRRITLQCAFDFADAYRTDILARGNFKFGFENTRPGSDTAFDKLDYRTVGGLVRDLPCAVLACPFPLAATGNGAGDAATGLARCLKKFGVEGNPSFACLFGGDYSGWMWVKVPSLMVGARMSGTHESLKDLVCEALDMLNAGGNLGVIPEFRTSGNHEIIAFAGTNDGFLSTLEPEHRPALAKVGRWLILCSDVTVLSRLIAEYDSIAARDGMQAPDWLRGMFQKDNDSYMCVDTVGAREAIANAVAAYQLILIAQGTCTAEEETVIVFGNEIKEWLARLASFEKCRLWLCSGDNSFAARIRFGPITPDDGEP